MNLSSKQAATEAAEYFHWRYQADALMADLLSSPNRHTRQLYAADLQSFRHWLTRRGHPAESVPLMLAVWLSHGRGHAQSLAEGYRDHLLAAGKSPGTVNRHLVTLRALARIARRMGRL